MPQRYRHFPSARRMRFACTTGTRLSPCDPIDIRIFIHHENVPPLLRILATGYWFSILTIRWADTCCFFTIGLAWCWLSYKNALLRIRSNFYLGFYFYCLWQQLLSSLELFSVIWNKMPLLTSCIHFDRTFSAVCLIRKWHFHLRPAWILRVLSKFTCPPNVPACLPAYSKPNRLFILDTVLSPPDCFSSFLLIGREFRISDASVVLAPVF